MKFISQSDSSECKNITSHYIAWSRYVRGLYAWNVKRVMEWNDRGVRILMVINWLIARWEQWCYVRTFPRNSVSNYCTSRYIVLSHTIQYNTIWYNKTQYNTKWCNTIQRNTIQYNTMLFFTLLYSTLLYFNLKKDIKNVPSM